MKGKKKKVPREIRIARAGGAAMAKATAGRARVFANKKDKLVSTGDSEIDEGVEEYQEAKDPAPSPEQEQEHHDAIEAIKARVREKFPKAIFKSGYTPDDVPVLDVFWIEDDQVKEVEKVAKADRPNGPFICILTHSISVTRRYYPEIAKTAEKP